MTNDIPKELTFLKKDRKFTCTICGAWFNHTNSKPFDIFRHALEVHDVTNSNNIKFEDGGNNG